MMHKQALLQHTQAQQLEALQKQVKPQLVLLQHTQAQQPKVRTLVQQPRAQQPQAQQPKTQQQKGPLSAVLSAVLERRPATSKQGWEKKKHNNERTHTFHAKHAAADGGSGGGGGGGGANAVIAFAYSGGVRELGCDVEGGAGSAL